jgi:hypothetical protein
MRLPIDEKWAGMDEKKKKAQLVVLRAAAAGGQTLSCCCYVCAASAAAFDAGEGSLSPFLGFSFRLLSKQAGTNLLLLVSASMSRGFALFLLVL